ncbi:MAG: tripartite tricarboxylate transporter substrate binding protein [Peptococcaceae bacterium]
MKLKKLGLWLLIVILMVSLVGCGTANKQSEQAQKEPEKKEEPKYPQKSIKIIVPYAPGGGTDVNARVIEKYAQKYLGTSVAIINKPGAGGATGAIELAKAEPDGYTIGYTNLPNMVQLALAGQADFTIDSFEPVVGQVIETKYLVVKKDSKFQTIDELIDFAKNNPGELIAANNGPASHNELVLKGFAAFAGIELNHVPFDGSGAAKTAILGGHAHMASMTATEFDEQFEPLVVFSKERSKEFPDTPTTFEKGLNLDMSSRRCLQAPKGTDKQVVDYLAAKFNEMFNDPEYISDMERSGSTPIYLSPKEVKEAISSDMEFLKEFEKKLAVK